MATYEAWADPRNSSITLATSEGIARELAQGLLSPKAALLYRFDAATFEEASAIHALTTRCRPTARELLNSTWLNARAMRTARIEKAMPAIFEGRGFLERRRGSVHSSRACEPQ